MSNSDLIERTEKLLAGPMAEPFLSIITELLQAVKGERHEVFATKNIFKKGREN